MLGFRLLWGLKEDKNWHGMLTATIHHHCPLSHCSGHRNRDYHPMRSVDLIQNSKEVFHCIPLGLMIEVTRCNVYTHCRGSSAPGLEMATFARLGPFGQFWFYLLTSDLTVFLNSFLPHVNLPSSSLLPRTICRPFPHIPSPLSFVAG